MKRLITLLLSIMMLSSLAVVSTAAPAAAWGPGCGSQADHYVKVWVNNNKGGASDYECGREYADNNTQRLRDDHLGNNTGVGTITNMNDKVSSIKVGNRGQFGICVSFFEHSLNNTTWGKRIQLFVRAPYSWQTESNASLNSLGAANDKISGIKSWVTDASEYCQDTTW